MPDELDAVGKGLLVQVGDFHQHGDGARLRRHGIDRQQGGNDEVARGGKPAGAGLGQRRCAAAQARVEFKSARNESSENRSGAKPVSAASTDHLTSARDRAWPK